MMHEAFYRRQQEIEKLWKLRHNLTDEDKRLLKDMAISRARDKRTKEDFMNCPTCGSSGIYWMNIDLDAFCQKCVDKDVSKSGEKVDLPFTQEDRAFLMAVGIGGLRMAARDGGHDRLMDEQTELRKQAQRKFAEERMKLAKRIAKHAPPGGWR